MTTFAHAAICHAVKSVQVGSLDWRPCSGQHPAVGCGNVVCLWSKSNSPGRGISVDSGACGHLSDMWATYSLLSYSPCCVQVGSLAWQPYSGQQLAVGCCNKVCLWSFGKCPAGGAPAQKVAVGGTFQTAWLSFLRTYQTGKPASRPLITEPQYLAYTPLPVNFQLETTACEAQPVSQ